MKRFRNINLKNNFRSLDINSFLRQGFIILLLIIPLGMIFSYGLFKFYSRGLPNLKDLTGYKPILVNEIYSSDGRLIGEFGFQKRKLVTLDELPEYVVNSFIAVEDKRFFEHKGVDLKGILRALVQNIKQGSVVAGGSTITQQVTKNLVLSSERTISRKIKEAILAYRIEKNLSKEEILYLYLNHIYLADGTYGVELASKNYFAKHAKDLTLAESALLAGIPKRPEYYSPRKNLSRALERQKVILKIMYDEKYITEEQYEEAINSKIKIYTKADLDFQVAPYFIEHVRRYLEAKVGPDEYKLGGFKVITTIDIDKSLAAHWALKRGVYSYEERWGRKPILGNVTDPVKIQEFMKSQKDLKLEKSKIYKSRVLKVEKLYEPVYLAHVRIGDKDTSFKFTISNPLGKSVKGLNFHLSKKFAPLNGYGDIKIFPQMLKKGDIMKVKIINDTEDSFSVTPVFTQDSQAALISIDETGNIITMVGGVDFKESQFNRATQALRQPGSAFKPLVYSAALDKGYTETSVLFDLPVIIEDWEPSNYDGKYNGPIVLREAISESRNLATIRLLLDIDPQYVVDYSNKFGFKSKLNPFPSLALGGSEVTVFDLVSAYTVFSNKGEWVTPRFILRMYDRDDVIIEDNTGEFFIANEKYLKKEREKKRKKILETLARKKGTILKEEEFLKEEDFNESEEEFYDDEQSFFTAKEFIDLLKNHDIYFGPAESPSDVIKTETAYIVTDLLKAVITEGTGGSAYRLNRYSDIAGKTGTTNDFTDAWFVGFSPNITTGVWVGRDNHKPLGKKESGARAALPIWIDYMEYVLSGTKHARFKVPNGVKFVETPYGRIPYRIDYLRSDVLDNLKTELSNIEIEGYLPPASGSERVNEKEFDEESEIDFLLRR